jgi:hypothetical protein
MIATAAPAAYAEDVPLGLAVEMPGGGSVDEIYVAFVRPERPWTRPTLEVVTSPTSTISVPAGDYRVIAGVPQYGLIMTDPIRVDPSRNRKLRLIFPSTRHISGTTRDTDGNPLSGVTVGDVNSFVEAPLGRVSELALRFMRPSWQTMSGPDGEWSLRVPSEGSVQIVAVASGYSVVWQENAARKPETIDFILSRGATLRVETSDVSPDYVITLEAVVKESAVPPAWQAQFWARHVRAPVLEWSSLAPGRYDVYLQHPDPRGLGPAAKLGTVELEPKRATELRAEALKINSNARSVSSVLIRPVAHFDGRSLSTFGRDARGGPREVAHATEEVSGGTLLHLDTSVAGPPFFGTTDEHFLALPVAAEVNAASVSPRGEASLQVRTVGASVPIPTTGMVTVVGCPNSGSVRIPVAVANRGKVNFAAPAGCSSLFLEFDPFSPIFIAKQLRAGLPEWLGERTLVASGRAAIRVAHGDGAPVSDAIVSVSVSAHGSQPATPLAQVTTSPDGWVRFERLPVGHDLTIVARSPEGEHSAVETIRTDPTRETVIDPLTIPKSAHLIVTARLDPEFVRQFPKGSILSLFIEPLDISGERRSKRPSGVDPIDLGRFLPGRWQLGAIVTAGEGAQPIIIEEIDLEEGEERLLEAVVTPLVFRGRVTGSTPDLTGNIDILSAKASDAVPSVALSSSGEFVAMLPRRDMYFVGVRPRSTGRMIWVGNTSFSDPAQMVEVVLPTGSVVARVRADGQPVSDVMVMARMEHQPTTDVPLVALPVRTGADGQARIEGLLAGAWIVFVPEGKYGEKRVTVSSDVTHVDLDLTEGLAVSGVVSDAAGAAVAGAKVTCLLPGPGGVPHLRVAFSQSDGSFDVGGRSPNRTMVLCSVTSFSGAQGYRVVPGEPARLVLSPSPASLTVSPLPPVDRFSSLWLMSSDRRLIDVSPYVARTPGDVSLIIPALAPEAWQLVRVTSPGDWLAIASGVGLPTEVATVTLKPNERKIVKLQNSGMGERSNEAR